MLVSTRFQVLFHSPPGVLFTFPSQYFTLSVTGEYLGLEGGPPVFPPGFTCPAVLWIQSADSAFRLQDFHFLWWSFPSPSAKLCQCVILSKTPHVLLHTVWPLPRSLATTSGISVDFSSSPYLDVSVQAVPHIYLCIQYMLTEYCSAGFPHSDIHGSMSAFDSPWLFVDRYVLLRLPVPRHSPCALISLTFLNYVSFMVLVVIFQ